MSILASKINLKPIRERFDAPNSSQETSNISFGCPDSCPKPLKAAPRPFKTPPWRCLEAPKRLQDRLWTSEDVAKKPVSLSKRIQIYFLTQQMSLCIRSSGQAYKWTVFNPKSTHHIFVQSLSCRKEKRPAIPPSFKKRNYAYSVLAKECSLTLLSPS